MWTKSTCEKDDQGNNQDKAESSASKGRPSEIKTAASKQEQQHNNEKQKIHSHNMTPNGYLRYGELP